MKFKLAILSFVIGICNPILMYSQVPGYLGKKLSISYNAELGLALKGVTQNNKGGGDILQDVSNYTSERSLGLSYNHKANLSYVVSRSVSLGLQASQYYTGLTTEMETVSLSNPNNFDEHFNLHRLNVKSVGIIYNKFIKERGALAPLGTYYNLGLERIWVTGEIIDRIVNTSSVTNLDYSKLSINQKHNFQAFSFGLGDNRIVHDRFIFKIGIVVRIPFLLSNIEQSYGKDYFFDERFGTDPNQVVFELDTFRRLVSHNIIKMEIGFGILL